jgi:hypothetical protein
MKLLKNSVLSKKEVVAIIGSSPQRQGRYLEGIKIVSPEAIKDYSGPIVVASLHHDESISSSITETFSWSNRVVRLCPS